MVEQITLTQSGHRRIEEDVRASFEARASSQEVRLLNDLAEIAIYGTRDQTTVYLDENGKPLTAPSAGKIEDMCTDLSFSDNADDRHYRATAYERDIDQLISEGYQLSQARLIMDKRDERVERVEEEQALLDKIISHYRKNGLTEAEAEKEALEDSHLATKRLDWDQEDAELKRTVRDEYIFTPEEYELVIEAQRRAQNSKHELETLKKDTDEARDEYVQHSAMQGARAIRLRRKYRESAITQARERYEQRKQELLECERANALEAGVDAVTFDHYAPLAAISEARKLAKEISDARKLASHKWVAEDIHIHTTGKHHGVIPVLDEARPLAKFKRFFFGKLWGKNDPDKSPGAALVLRRTAITAGIPATLVGSMLLPPVGVGLVVASGVGLSRLIVKKLADWKPGYKPGRTAKWMLNRETMHEEVLFSAATSVIPRAKTERTQYSDAELDKALGYAMIHADPANQRLNHLDDTIADMIDQETKQKVLV